MLQLRLSEGRPGLNPASQEGRRPGDILPVYHNPCAKTTYCLSKTTTIVLFSFFKAKNLDVVIIALLIFSN